MNGSAPARLSASFLFTRVQPGPDAPEGAQVMRQFPPRPCPDRWPGTVLDREQASALLLAPPFRLENRNGQRQRSPAPTSGSAVCGPANLVALRMGMKGVTVYSATSDPNHLLGRQGEYTSKVDWTISGENSGIEAFPDAANAKIRYAYLRAFRPPIGDGYDYLYHAAILRLASIYTPSQAAKLKALLRRSCSSSS